MGRAWVGLLLLVAGCRTPAEAELLVVVRTTFAIPSELDRITIEVSGWPEVVRHRLTAQESLPASLAIIPGPAGVNAGVRVTVRGFVGATMVRETIASTGFVPGSARVLEMWLVRDCAPAECVGGETCGLGGCVPIERDPRALPTWNVYADGGQAGLDAGADAGIDGRVPDGQIDADGGRCLPELCNGIDDDCDRLVDENEGNLDLMHGAISTGGRVDHCGRCFNVCADCRQGFCGLRDAAPGLDVTCVVGTEDTSRLCFGDASEAHIDGLRPADPATGPNMILEIESGGFYGQLSSCVVLPVDLVSSTSNCWGAINDGASSPQVEHSGGLRQISVGATHACGVRGGRVMCWGLANVDSPTPSNCAAFWAHTTSSLTAIEIGVPFTPVERVSVGGTSACAIAGGHVYCWGSNHCGEQGRGLASAECGVFRVQRADGTPLSDAVDVSCAGGHPQTSTCVLPAHCCAALADGRVACWGDNRYGQVHPAVDSSPMDRAVLVPGLDGVRDVEVGPGISCAIAASDIANRDDVFCWGGDGLRGVPGNVAGAGPHSVERLRGLSIRELRFGPDRNATTSLSPATHALATTWQGELYCWGRNAEGQCDVTIDDDPIYEPVRITPPMRAP